mmetsp:Transcript_5725/g.7319  ORF Transcript_5725/g.7319 Transcript_5725/m.7319 type:complete len:90 (-) Transcript_5725:646-915(-)
MAVSVKAKYYGRGYIYKLWRKNTNRQFRRRRRLDSTGTRNDNESGKDLVPKFDIIQNELYVKALEPQDDMTQSDSENKVEEYDDVFEQG